MYAVSNHLDMETSISKRLVMTPHFPDNTMSETNHLGTIKKVKLKEEAIATQCVKSCLSVSEVALWPRWPLIERHSSAKCQQTPSHHHHHDLILEEAQEENLTTPKSCSFCLTHYFRQRKWTAS